MGTDNVDGPGGSRFVSYRIGAGVRYGVRADFACVNVGGIVGKRWIIVNVVRTGCALVDIGCPHIHLCRITAILFNYRRHRIMGTDNVDGPGGSRFVSYRIGAGVRYGVRADFACVNVGGIVGKRWITVNVVRTGGSGIGVCCSHNHPCRIVALYYDFRWRRIGWRWRATRR